MIAARLNRIGPKAIVIGGSIALTPLMLFSPGVLLRGWRWVCSHDIALDSIDGAQFFSEILVSGSMIWLLSGCAALALAAKSISRSGTRLIAGLPLLPIGVGLFSFVFVWSAIDFEAAEKASFQRVIANSTPLIAALHKYKEDYGEYPPSVSILVPRYLPEIPRTGVLGQREFQYNYPRRRFARPDGNGFELYVRFGIEDVLFYVSDPRAREYYEQHSPVYLSQSGGWIFEDT